MMVEGAVNDLLPMKQWRTYLPCVWVKLDTTLALQEEFGVSSDDPVLGSTPFWRER